MNEALTPFQRDLLDEAVRQAVKSLEEGGIPIGSAIGSESVGIVGAGHNRRVQTGDTTAHAEIEAFRDAGRRDDWPALTLASTLSPCVMCTGATLLHRVGTVIIGEHETFMGAEDLMRAHGVRLILADDRRCIELMERFIDQRPELWNEDIGMPGALGTEGRS
ncbi:MAG: nucleoside deaminase [Phycisphaerales bacterium]